MSRSKRSVQTAPRSSVRLLAGLVVILTAIGVIAVLVLANGSPRVVATDSGAPGRLVASQPTIDLGRVPFDKPVEARFELANTGADTVRLVGAPRVRMLEGC